MRVPHWHRLRHCIIRPAATLGVIACVSAAGHAADASAAAKPSIGGYDASGCGMLPGDSWSIGGCGGGLAYFGPGDMSPSGTGWGDRRLNSAPAPKRPTPRPCVPPSGKPMTDDELLTATGLSTPENRGWRYAWSDEDKLLVEFDGVTPVRAWRYDAATRLWNPACLPDGGD